MFQINSDDKQSFRVEGVNLVQAYVNNELSVQHEEIERPMIKLIYCEKCDKTLSGDSEWAQHYKSKKHKRKKRPN